MAIISTLFGKIPIFRIACTMSLVSSSLVTSMADLSTGCLKTKMSSARDKTSCQVCARAARQVLDIDVNLACFGANKLPSERL
ncbi:uncharacterized protein F5891DRAFT_1061949 [Suillus fuscotomentosus]|uniref:Uncharacterized protein n=1 Tax=Suillus fuscotomentosus TaxID=1912939 RepID=A0AAD4HF54_9AGAM|nr:uncharacterized protein F5891DRAFT_1089422 [Suillus fuscotomentosus]XP_041219889.1 uncharacterized protein F5891DRAFT_1062832 [Suillus fuscotomentosus]XP_041220293.1 uncharacterized protein F5891DRAFT_1061949 [Suillus fuscotomentosus]KAG1884821.1 hypothetical protein F5891DRAFT_1089422 [Suillus fuscotomentosus]KAG1894313.1 hypothetical protein F5891DRAFT_1062832 [Suillus fuscotomentosus]KAG1894717.1 hypothetical protein F5891DRAFT_1061949 [Suillus fuscotomentosus]